MDEIIYEKLSSLSEVSKAKLQKILKNIPNPKDLTIETNLIKPLERICGVSWLKAHGVEKIYKLEADIKPKKTNTQLFMIYTHASTFQKVLQQIQSQVDINNPEFNKFHVICMPKFLYYYETLIEENALSDIVQLYSFQWFPIHLDVGILSLEMPGMFKQIYIQDDYTLLPAFAKNLWHLFLCLGKPEFCLNLGSHSQSTMKQLDVLLSGSKLDKSDFGGLIIIDRNMDYPSALLTPGTYAALLNEVYGVSCGICREEKPPQDIVACDHDEQHNKLPKKQPVNLVMDSGKDSVYKMIRDKYFIEVTENLRHLTKDLKVQGATSDMALHEMKRYVETKLQSLAQKKQLVASHLNAAETLVNFLHNRLQKLIDVEANILHNQSKSKSLATLEEYLQSERDSNSSLALFLLLCITQKVTDSEVKSFMTKFFIEFGYDKGILYRKLVKTNLIDCVSNSKLKIQLLNKSTFFANASKLKQLNAEPEKINLKNPTCCSYVFGGIYIPLVAQICSLVLSGTPLEDLRQKLQSFGELGINGQYVSSKRSLMVYILGGITYSEIAALNLLEAMMGVKIVAMSDKIISKRDIVNSFIDV